MPNGIEAKIEADGTDPDEAAMSYNQETRVIAYYPDAHDPVENQEIIERVMRKKTENIVSFQQEIVNIKESRDFLELSDEEKEAVIKKFDAELERLKFQFPTINAEEQIAVGKKYDPETAVMGQFTHEVGHAVFFQLLNDEEIAIVEDFMPHRGGAAKYISGYAYTCLPEFFAEAYALYKSKILKEQKKKIPEKLRAIMEKYAPEKRE